MKLKTPLTKEKLKGIRSGETVYISGVIYTARDAAHKRLVELIEEGKELPFELDGQIIYYVGPTPPKEGEVIGSAGPTTSYRMDPYTPQLLKKGLKGMIGKGNRSLEVRKAMKEEGAVYFAAVGGAAALIAKSIKESEVIAYEDLGSEAVRRMVVEDFPVILINDLAGNDLYELGRKEFAE